MLAGPIPFQAYSREAQVYFSCDIDATIKTLAVGIKKMQSLRMSAMLNDVDAALKEAAGNITFQSDCADVAKGDTREAEACDVEPNVHSVVDEEQITDAGGGTEDGFATEDVDVDMDDGATAKGVVVDTDELCSEFELWGRNGATAKGDGATAKGLDCGEGMNLNKQTLT
jgi:hypothetical protein